MNTCVEPGCDRDAIALDRCEIHYRQHRARKLGPCSIDGCERMQQAKGLCGTHYRRQLVRGTTDYAPPPLVETYGGMHQRLRTVRVAVFACVDCGERACEWSYDHDDPNERVEVDRRATKVYSLDPRHYVPRCTQCHRAFDNTYVMLMHNGRVDEARELVAAKLTGAAWDNLRVIA